MKPTERWLHPTAAVCLLLSGVAGLVYQVAWARYLALLLGHTSYAVVAVLVAFMGGLALGNVWLGRQADRVRRPLAFYGWLELGIAAYAWLFPTYYGLCESGYLALAAGTKPGGPWLLGLKFAFGFAAILVPTTLMGGTLPVLTRCITRSLGELRARVASLYFLNSLGAVAGVMIAEFWWLPAFGLDDTVQGGAVLNAIVGMLALAVSRALQEGERRPRPTPTLPGTPAAASGNQAATPGPSETYDAADLRLAIIAAGVSGFVAMLYEVVWTRLLALALGSSTHAFSIMLVTFIAGIATGSWIIGRWRNLRRTFDAFGWAELALGLLLLLSVYGYHLLPYAFARLGAVIVRDPRHFAIYQAAQFLVCFAVMFGPALCLGMTLPLASRVATSELARAGRSVGLVFSVNTLGTVLGAALTGLVLLPLLDLAPTFMIGIGLNLAVALAVLCRRHPAARRTVLTATPILLLALVILANATLNRTWQKAFALGIWRLPSPPNSLAEYLATVRDFDLRFHRDGAGSTVDVNGWQSSPNGRVELSLRVNGKADATTQGDLSTQVLLAHIPLLLHTNASDVLVVGVGSGITCASALTHPDVRRLDAVEISPEVVEAARSLFPTHNRRALEDPRVSVVLDDAKSFLKTTGRRYDVIVSEPSNPWMAGVAGVFTLEFYETCRASLKPGGLMVQWVHVYESNDEALQTVLATYASVFPFLTLWQTLPGDLVLVGSTRPLTYDLDTIQRRFDLPDVTTDLRRADLFRLPVLLALQMASDFNAPFLAPPETVRHSDFHPRLEYIAERGFFARDAASLHQVFNETALRRPTTLLGEYLRRHPLTVADTQSFALFHTSFKLPEPRLMRSIVERWRELDPQSTLAAEFSSKMEYTLPVSELEAQRLAALRSQMFTNTAPAELETFRMYSRHLMNAYRNLRSAFYQPPVVELKAVLTQLVEVDDVHRQSHLLRLAEIAWDTGEDAKFAELASRALLPSKGAPLVGRYDLDYASPGNVLAIMIGTLWRSGNLVEAKQWCQAVRQAGYLRPESQFYSPRVALEVRKVEVTSTATPDSPANPPASR